MTLATRHTSRPQPRRRGDLICVPGGLQLTRLQRYCLCLAAAASLASAGELAAHGELHEQIATVSAEIRQTPDRAELYLKRADLHRLHGDFAEAERDYGKAEQLSPKLAAVDLGRGQLMLVTGRLEEAGRNIDRYLEVEPKNGEAWIIRARIHSRAKENLPAAKAFTTALEFLRRPEPEYYRERASALAAAGPDHLDEAIRGLEEGMKRLGPIITLTLQAIELEAAGGRFDSALKRIDMAIEKAPRKEAWFERRGDLLVQMERPEDAKRAFQDALNAIAALPPRARNTAATQQLETRLRTKVADPAAAGVRKPAR
jgi:tetratricopeptide (TPR) repeat protein